MAAWSRTQIHMCDIVASQTWKMDERKGVDDDDHEDIEKQASIFHILNGILAETRNVIYRGFVGSGESTTPSPGCTETQSQEYPWRAEAPNKKLLWELQESRRPDVNMIKACQVTLVFL